MYKVNDLIIIFIYPVYRIIIIYSEYTMPLRR